MPGTYISPAETGFYLTGTRYFDPEVGRFISMDTIVVLTATPMGLTDKNLYAYCDNNPIVRVDRSGQFWESAFDVISLGASIVEVCVNPTDIWAWAGLVGDAVDLVPFVTGVGEVTRTVKTTVKVTDKATDVLDTAKTLYKTADSTSDIRKASGSYEILYSSGKNYIGKGSFNRAINSAKAHAESMDDILSIRWKSAPSSYDAFIDEYLMQKRFGGVLRSSPELPTYNIIWSPGRNFYGR
ncbi:MAG: RHS repeat-associated core domain-containing protein [Tyzzerella sp.]|nr:RHS repeat-associated core domain-containing protein [Tyzzerella sp.]